LKLAIFTVPYDSGRLRQRMALGPDRILEAGLRPLLLRLGLEFQQEEVLDGYVHAAEIASSFTLCRNLADRVRAARAEGRLPIVLSGNCGIAVGAVSGCGVRDTGVIWFDAHGESHTPETTTSGFLDGMGSAILTGQCCRALAGSIPGFQPLLGSRVLLVGSRDVEPAEAALLDRVGVVRTSGVGNLRPLIAQFAESLSGVYVHFDLDVLDPAEAVANQWTPKGGLTLKELLGAVTAICDCVPVAGFGFGSYDPLADSDGRALRAVEAIAELLLTRRPAHLLAR
jgi:arginase